MKSLRLFSSVTAVFLFGTFVRAETSATMDRLLVMLDPARIAQCDDKTFVATLPQALFVLDQARRSGAAPESLLRNALRAHEYEVPIAKLVGESFLRALSRCDVGNVFSNEDNRKRLEAGLSVRLLAGPNASAELLPDFVIMPFREPFHGRNLANLEMRTEQERHQPALDARRKAWNERLWLAVGGRPKNAMTSAAAEPLEIQSINTALDASDEMPTTESSGVFHRIDLTLNQAFDLTPFGASDIGITLKAVQSSSIKYSINDYNNLRTVTRFDDRGQPYTQTVPTSKNYSVAKENGIDIKGNLAKAYLIFDVPNVLRVYYYDALDYSDNQRPILVETLVPKK
jgi:hypothetical protein